MQLHRLRRPALALLASALVAPFAAADVFSSFEFTDLSGQFSLGTAPLDVTYTGGEAKTAMILSLYHSGQNAWMVDGGAAASITFGAAPEGVDFFFRDQDPSVQSTVTVLDPGNQVLATFQGTDASWTHVVVPGPIGRVDVVNNAAGAGLGYTAIDDMTTLFQNTQTYCTAKTATGPCLPASGFAGVPSATASSGFTLTTSNVPPGNIGIFFYGQSGPAATPFQGSFLCVQPPTLRTPPVSSGMGGLCGGAYSIDFNAYLATGVDPALVVGAQIWIQNWFRDPPDPVSGTGLSQGTSFVICP